jgi:hypothetical protein
MTDPRLNSLHLDPARRQDYRRARAALLHSCGDRTMYAECRHGDEGGSATAVWNGGDGPVDFDCWLMDREFIYPLRVGVNTLGRSPDNDVVVEDSCVSRRHCVILVHANRACELFDTASRNGTYLNGNRLTRPAGLAPGAEVRVGDRQLVLFVKPDWTSTLPASPVLG